MAPHSAQLVRRLRIAPPSPPPLPPPPSPLSFSFLDEVLYPGSKVAVVVGFAWPDGGHNCWHLRASLSLARADNLSTPAGSHARTFLSRFAPWPHRSIMSVYSSQEAIDTDDGSVWWRPRSSFSRAFLKDQRGPVSAVCGVLFLAPMVIAC